MHVKTSTMQGKLYHDCVPTRVSSPVPGTEVTSKTCSQMVPDEQLHLHHALDHRPLLRRRHVRHNVPLRLAPGGGYRQRQALVAAPPGHVHLHSHPCSRPGEQLNPYCSSWAAATKLQQGPAACRERFCVR